MVSNFTSRAGIRHWVRLGFLNIINWDPVPSYWPYWDQILIYNHAVLVFHGRPVFLAFIDIDEYVSWVRRGEVVSIHPPVKNDL